MLFFKYFILHKYYVFIAGLRLGGIPITSLLFHDMTKLLYKEEFAAFYEKQTKGIGDIKKYSLGWLSHQNRNKHHYEYWIMGWNGKPNTYDEISEPIGDFLVVLPMPEVYIREMVADWFGASKVYKGSWDFTEWLNSQWQNMIFHTETEEKLISLLSGLKFKLNEEGVWVYG